MEANSFPQENIMGAIGCPEIREWGLTASERAAARDSFVREFEKQYQDWSSIAKVCIDVERDKDWQLLGFESYHSWLMDAAPKSRSYIYLVVGRYKELIPDIPEEKLREIPLGSAGVLMKVSSRQRKDPKVIEAAKEKPGKFIKDLEEIAPDQHIERTVRMAVEFTSSQWEVVSGAYEAYKLIDENASLAIFIEWLCSEASEWTLHVNQENEGRKNNSNGAGLH
jgi:hypothetical protein